MDYFDDLNPFLVRQDTTSSNQSTITPAPVIDQSYVENILRINVGKRGTFYFTYTGSQSWLDKVYTGVIEQAGRDHFIIYDSSNNKRYLLQLIYLLWAEFDEEIDYQFSYQ